MKSLSVGLSKSHKELVLILGLISVSLLVASCYGDASQDDSRLKAPWVASIFYKNPNTELWEYICSGTITGEYTVITSLRCVRPRVTEEKFSKRPYHLNYASLQVVAGLKTNDYTIGKDEHTQYATVGQIRDLHQNRNIGDTPFKDLAGLRLKSSLNVSTPYVQSVYLTEQVDTILEANATKPGATVLVAGFERQDLSSPGVKTRSKSVSTLKIHQVTLGDISSCVEKYTESYENQVHYFDVLCGKSITKDPIPCHLEGAGMITKVTDTQDPKKESLYLMGVYSSNTASAKSEGTLKTKNLLEVPPCTSSDFIFFTKLGYLGRWGISHSFCSSDLATCQNDRCRPWKDLCDGEAQCDDGSDEDEKVCFNQGPCTPNQFRCKYGACIEKSKVCNGANNCQDGSDEDPKGICKDSPPTRIAQSCKGIPPKQGVEHRCSHPDRKGVFSCEKDVPIGTSVVFRRNEIRAVCTKDGDWSKNVNPEC